MIIVVIALIVITVINGMEGSDNMGNKKDSLGDRMKRPGVL